jgi:hypothetical protein
MAFDRFVYFKKKAMPKKADLGKALKAYVAGAGRVYWERDRFYAVLPGKPSHAVQHKYPMPKEIHSSERWVEVWLGDNCVDVMTRCADQYTNAVADGFVKICVDYYKGKVRC